MEDELKINKIELGYPVLPYRFIVLADLELPRASIIEVGKP
jgi:hypothetical protein